MNDTTEEGYEPLAHRATIAGDAKTSMEACLPKLTQFGAFLLLVHRIANLLEEYLR